MEDILLHLSLFAYTKCSHPRLIKPLLTYLLFTDNTMHP